VRSRNKSKKNKVKEKIIKSRNGTKDAKDTKGLFRNVGVVGRSAVEYVRERQDRGRLRAATQKQTIQVRDPGKRQRIIFLAAVLVAFVVGLKIWRRGEWSFNEAVVTAAVAAFFSYVGLFWAFRFDVRKMGFLSVLPQPSMFIFCSVLFLTLFFFQQFERIYESLVFGLFLLGFVGVLTAVFLTANILNVATIKQLPLLRVAQTSSYVISLFSIYFITFSLVSGGFNVILMLVLLLLFYYLIIWMHLSHFSMSESHVRLYAFSVSWGAMSAIAAFLFWPVGLLFIALAPVVVVYVGMGIIMQYIGKNLTARAFGEFILLAVFALMVIVLRAKWGIYGFFGG